MSTQGFVAPGRPAARARPGAAAAVVVRATAPVDAAQIIWKDRGGGQDWPESWLGVVGAVCVCVFVSI